MVYENDLNLADFSLSGALALGIGQKVCLWTEGNGFLLESEKEIKSVKWCSVGGQSTSQILAVGTADSITIWDTKRAVPIQNFPGLPYSVGSLAWNKHLLTAGGSDGSIVSYDVRSKQKVAWELRGHHTGSVTRLAWSQNKVHLVSGCSDGTVHIWDTSKFIPGQSTPLVALNFSEPISVLSWCPWSPHANLFVIGVGASLQFFNVDGEECHRLTTEEDISSFQWCKHRLQFVTMHRGAHGNIIHWKFPSFTQIKSFQAHNKPIFYSAASPNHTTVATASSDNTVKLWSIFEPKN